MHEELCNYVKMVWKNFKIRYSTNKIECQKDMKLAHVKKNSPPYRNIFLPFNLIIGELKI